jgi:hypothetical protein
MSGQSYSVIKSFNHFMMMICLICFFDPEPSAWAVERSAGRFSDALFTLGSVPEGLSLLKMAIRNWELEDLSDLLNHFKWGSASHTDTVITRYFNPKSGKEDRQSEITIYLRNDQSQLELVMDMAHELVHATGRSGIDPYDSTLTVGKYIWSAIEGAGGEVQATLTECQVGLELAKKLKMRVQRCEPYLNPWRVNAPSGISISRDKIIKNFYRVGKWGPELKQWIGEEVRLFPHLSQDAPTLYSSTGHTPYPVALFREFEEITETACKNSENRMRTFASALPSAWITSAPESPQSHLEHFIKKRCH